MQNNLSSRDKRINLIYSFYLVNNKSHVDLMKNHKITKTKDISIINNLFENISILQETVESFLKDDWSWNRINHLEKAILVNGAYELLMMKNKLPIVVSTSNAFAVKFLGKEVNIRYITAIFNKIGEQSR